MYGGNFIVDFMAKLYQVLQVYVQGCLHLKRHRKNEEVFDSLQAVEKLFQEYLRQVGEEYPEHMKKAALLKSIPQDWLDQLQRDTDLDAIEAEKLEARLQTMCSSHTTGSAKMELSLQEQPPKGKPEYPVPYSQYGLLYAGYEHDYYNYGQQYWYDDGSWGAQAWETGQGQEQAGVPPGGAPTEHPGDGAVPEGDLNALKGGKKGSKGGRKSLNGHCWECGQFGHPGFKCPWKKGKGTGN